MTPVLAAGVTAIGAAIVTFVRTPHSTGDLISIAALFVGMVVVERFPVPVEGVESGGVTLGYVLAVATIVLFGWQAGIFIAAGGATVTHLIGHRPPLRVAYNGAMFALSAMAAGLLIRLIDGGSVGALIARVALCAFLYNWVVNLVLITAVVSAASGKPFFKQIRDNARQTTAPFALMASAALMLVVMWQRSPALSLALVGPLLAIALYQRSTFAALKAMRLALTDPLTGLGNHRHFHERLQRELAAAEDRRTLVSLCFLDVDDFKRINDQFGHPAGDRVLSQLSSRLRQGGESFRLGGDEFAVLLPGADEAQALAAAESIVGRIGQTDFGPGGPITVSVGIATYPQHGRERDSLIRLADGALYWAKENGKNQVRLARPDVEELSEFRRVAHGRDRAARFRAAASLARAVDSRDAYTGSHSERVAQLAAQIAERLGLGQDQIELTRLAGSLHDLGKLAIPEEILRKPSGLTDAERLVLERHPQIGHRMLESLGVDPIADWVLHHHERWDGAGYPDKLAGDDIPLGARIIFVADAFDAMTSNRLYRKPISRDAALREVQRCAGSQFDPEIVQAFFAAIGVAPAAVA